MKKSREKAARLDNSLPIEIKALMIEKAIPEHTLAITLCQAFTSGIFVTPLLLVNKQMNSLA